MSNKVPFYVAIPLMVLSAVLPFVTVTLLRGFTIDDYQMLVEYALVRVKNWR